LLSWLLPAAADTQREGEWMLLEPIVTKAGIHFDSIDEKLEPDVRPQPS
jgi:hypothetical protein